MGCDVHMRAEVRHNGAWMPAGRVFDPSSNYGPIEFQRGDSRSSFKTEEPWEGRNYDLFSMLANVRNGYGFKPIAEPRGVPRDAHPATAAFVQNAGGYSYSWHTLRQLREYDWNQEIVNRERWRWHMTYREAAGEAWFRTLDRLAELIPENGTDDDVRIVFSFDS